MAAEIFEWIDPDGTTTELDVEWDVDGRFMPPSRRVEEEVPLQAGSRVRSVRHGPRDLRMLCWFEAATEEALRTQLRALIRTMDPTRGDGRLRITAPAGDQRELTCRYVAGLEMPEQLGDTAGPGLQRAAVVLRATDPFWYDVATTSATYETGTPATFFPFFPLRLSASEVFADATLDNGGDVETWPVWTIVGPGSEIVLRNLTTGKALTLDHTLADGESVTIDTRPGSKTVLDQDGVSRFSSLTASSSLWPLERGSNSIRVEVTGATAATAVTVAFKKRYLPT